MRTDPTNCGLSLGDRDVAPRRGRPPIRFTGAALLLLLLLVLTPAVVGGASDPPAGNAEEPVLKVHPLWSVDRARGGDRMSSFGDAVAVSETVDVSLARLLRREVSDLIVAPAYEPEALEILRRKRGGRYLILQIDPAYEPPPTESRDAFGFTLTQVRNTAPIDAALLKNVVSARRELPSEALQTLIVATIGLMEMRS